ncbi:unnamed protein product [Mycena citricolor]|uniref:Serine/threonine-protein phosphatase 4 regulatory subunit 3-like central domain-containing protein n=1 Tax=Mycena citricolor TaxID=2018698 RepID=A0AAD2GTH5_9AGAR|nr:unnamed protein product [Mycena citricolor]
MNGSADPAETPPLPRLHGDGAAGPAVESESDPTLPSSSPPPPDDDVLIPAGNVALTDTVSPEETTLDRVAREGDEDGLLTVHTSDLNGDDLMLETVGGQADEAQEWYQDPQEQEMKRVKVYELVGQRWVDQGTAFCFGQISEDSDTAHLIARSERNYNEVILSTPIRSTDVYQRQQDTLIVWTEPNGADYALSFQDPEGCAEVWNFICEVQHHLSTAEEPATTLEPGPSQRSSSELPTPELGTLADIERIIKGLSRQSQLKDFLADYIMREDYFKKLISVFREAEDLESVRDLHTLCSVTQAILNLNDHNLYEYILADEHFTDIVGMLEYDPDFPNHRANYREFLKQTSQFHEPIPIKDPAMQRKIHYTYRLQFLKDVVLARALDDSTFNVLNSCIIFNQIDIITHMQQDASFLREVVRLYVDEEMLAGRNGAQSQHGGSYAFAPPENLSPGDLMLRRQVVFLLQQLCAMGKNVQLPARMALFRTLVDRGILFAVQWALGLESESDALPVVGAGGEVLAALLDHDAFGVRGHVLKQVLAIDKEREAKKRGADKAETLVELVCRLVARNKNFAVQSQLGDALKVFMDIPPPGEAGAQGPSEAAPGGIRNQRRDEPGTERFMDYFYRDCIAILFKPMIELPEWKTVSDPIFLLTREETNRFTYLADLLHNFISQHNFRAYFYVASSQILARIPTLLRARDKHLQHAVCRIFRLLLRLKNANLHVQVMRHDAFKPILDLTLRESRRDNLISGTCLDYFDCIRKDNMKDMIKFCMVHHEAEIRQLANTALAGSCFQQFIQRWEMNNEPPPPEGTPVEKPAEPRWPSAVRAQDTEEEDYFNADDDEDAYIPPISQHQVVRGGLKRKRASSSVVPRSPSPSPSLGSLMDYGEDDDDELVPGPSPKRPIDQDDEDDEDNMLEALVRGNAGPRLGEKRRRPEEEEEDEMLERLSKKALLKTDDPPAAKKMKLKFGSAAAASINGAKDGDTG